VCNVNATILFAQRHTDMIRQALRDGLFDVEVRARMHDIETAEKDAHYAREEEQAQRLERLERNRSKATRRA
jgi:hypothetical protein